MAFGPSIPKVGHFSIAMFGLNGGLSHAHHLFFVGPPTASFGLTLKPIRNPLTFALSGVSVNWTNPLSGKMFPVKPLPGISGGGGGGHGTVGYGS